MRNLLVTVCCLLFSACQLRCTVTVDDPQQPDAEVSETTEELGQCDPIGAVCGDDLTSGTCIYCATHGPCAGIYNACNADPSCVAYMLCLSPCPDQACMDACDAALPVGFVRYMKVLHCVGCRCQDSCDALGETCP
jgi:hypothetical protein